MNSNNTDNTMARGKLFGKGIRDIQEAITRSKKRECIGVENMGLEGLKVKRGDEGDKRRNSL